MLEKHFMFLWKIMVYPCRLLNSSSIYCLEHFVNSSFLQYLATTLENVLNFSSFLLIWHHWEVKTAFFWSLASWNWMTWYKLKRNHHNRSHMVRLMPAVVWAPQKILWHIWCHHQGHSTCERCFSPKIKKSS